MKSFLAILIALLTGLPHAEMLKATVDPGAGCGIEECRPHCPCCEVGKCECVDRKVPMPPEPAPVPPGRTVDPVLPAAMPPQTTMRIPGASVAVLLQEKITPSPLAALRKTGLPLFVRNCAYLL